MPLPVFSEVSNYFLKYKGHINHQWKGETVMNQMKKKILSVLLSAATALSVCTSAWAADTVPKQVVIELEAVSEEKEHYLPKEQADYTVVLKNKLGPSWLRVKFTFTGKNVDRTFSDKSLNIQDGWIKQGDYFYYTKKAEAYTDYTIVKGVKIPDVVPSGEGASVTVSVYGEAVQYDGFRPDFASKEPWKGAEVKHASQVSGTSPRRSPGSSFTAKPITLYSSPQEKGNSMEGRWELADAGSHSWKYQNSNGNYAKNGWIYVKNPYGHNKEQYDWFHFDKDGIMTVGWYRTDGGVWYYCHEVSDGNLGKLVKGWHEDSQDGKKYYLDKKTGIMLSGWQEIDGHSYYFTAVSEAPKQTWFWKRFGDTGFGKWVYGNLGYRSYGSMYVNERTPDGQRVNEEGINE